ncbi:LOW QUALITY PROTEIN: hypothetical protein HID58_048412, partial [Brassica napus]
GGTGVPPSGDPEAGVLPGVWKNSIPEYFSSTVTIKSMQSNMKECIKGKNYEASLFIKSKGATKEPLFKKQQKQESQKIKKRIIQKEGSSENRDPTKDLGMTPILFFRISMFHMLPQPFLHELPSGQGFNLLSCRATMSCIWPQIMNTSPINLRRASTQIRSCPRLFFHRWIRSKKQRSGAGPSESMDSSGSSLDLTAKVENLSREVVDLAPSSAEVGEFPPVGSLSSRGVDEVANWRAKYHLSDEVVIRIPGPIDRVSDFEVDEVQSLWVIRVVKVRNRDEAGALAAAENVSLREQLEQGTAEIFLSKKAMAVNGAIVVAR